MSPATTTTERSSAALLSEAVHQNGKFSREGTLERVFTLAFRQMVYPQIWEDPDVDLEALAINPTSRVMTIASGGCNVMNYLTADPAAIHAVDLNTTHLALLDLKLTAVQHLPSHTAFYRFFGEADDRRNVALYDNTIARHLQPSTRAYWEARDYSGRRRITRFARNFYRYGLLGRFIRVSRGSSKLLGCDPALLLSAATPEEQEALFDRHMAPLFDKWIVRSVTAHRASLFGLGIPPAQYDALSEGGTRQMHDVLRERVRRLACGTPLRQNYFAWQAFAGRYGSPQEADPPPYLARANYDCIKARAGRVSWRQRNMIHFLADQPAASLDRYVLLDAQDWMDDDTLNALWRQITRTAAPGARVIFRTAGGATILPGRLTQPLLSAWAYQERRSAALHARDRSAIYGGFHLYTRED